MVLLDKEPVAPVEVHQVAVVVQEMELTQEQQEVLAAAVTADTTRRLMAEEVAAGTLAAAEVVPIAIYVAQMVVAEAVVRLLLTQLIYQVLQLFRQEIMVVAL
jgi:hypothetical protein